LSIESVNADMNSSAHQLLTYSDSQARASLIDSSDNFDISMPKRRKSRAKSGKRKSRKRTGGRIGKARSRIRLSGGRVVLKVPGFKGVHKFRAAALLAKFPQTKIRAAAKTLLRSAGVSKRGKKTKRKKGRKRKGSSSSSRSIHF